jgi:hypothetical protein
VSYGITGNVAADAYRKYAKATVEPLENHPLAHATDFAVLCSKCHRMIRRTADPSNLAAVSGND